MGSPVVMCDGSFERRRFEFCHSLPAVKLDWQSKTVAHNSSANVEGKEGTSGSTEQIDSQHCTSHAAPL